MRPFRTFQRWYRLIRPPNPGILLDRRNRFLFRRPLLGVHESTDDVQRHRRRPDVKQQGIRKGRRTPGVVAQWLDEAAVLGD